MASKASVDAPRTKLEAVHRAIVEGHDKPDEGVAYIRATFGIDMPTKHFSTYKSQLRKREERPAKRPSSPARGATSC